MLPLVERELRVASRKRRTYRVRAFIALAAIVVGAFTLLTMRPSAVNAPGRSIFQFFSSVGLIYCFYQSFRQTADCLASEKREGTIGLLFLTDLRPFDIVTGKLAAQGIQTFYNLLGFFPLLSICLVLGGVTGTEFTRTIFLLANTLFVTLSMGMLGSALFTRTIHCVVATMVLFAGLLIVPAFFLVWSNPAWAPYLAAISPLNAYSWAMSVAAPSGGYFWIGQAIAHFIAWMVLLLSGRVLAKNWQLKEVKPAPETVSRKSRAEMELKAELLDRNPFMWLTYRPGERRGFFWLLFVIGMIFSVVVFFTTSKGDSLLAGLAAANYPLSFVFFLYLCSQSSRNFAEATRSDAFELILATPLTVPEIIRGQFLALRKFFLIPACILLGIKITLLFLAPGSVRLGLDILNFVLSWYCVSWFGMLMGLTRGPMRAFFATFIWSYLVPMIFCIPGFVVSIILIAVARQKVQSEFRKVIGQKYQQSQFFTL
ncbi:MAG: hypothetical protein ACO1QB_08320 [Verrucomicrobiales bacterium]